MTLSSTVSPDRVCARAMLPAPPDPVRNSRMTGVIVSTIECLIHAYKW